MRSRAFVHLSIIPCSLFLQAQLQAESTVFILLHNVSLCNSKKGLIDYSTDFMILIEFQRL